MRRRVARRRNGRRRVKRRVGRRRLTTITPGTVGYAGGHTSYGLGGAGAVADMAEAAMRGRSRSRDTGPIKKRLRYRSGSGSRLGIRTSTVTKASGLIPVTNSKGGKPRKVTLNGLRKILMYICIRRWQRVRPMQRPLNLGVGGAGATLQYPGGCPLFNNMVGQVGLDEKYYVPMHVYLLNGTPNGSVNPGVAYDVHFGATGNPVFSLFDGTGPTGAATAVWSNEYQNQTGAGGTHRYTYLQWVEIRMLMYGVKTQTTKYRVQVVSFPEPEDDPLSDVSSMTATQIQGRNSVWQQQVEVFAKNPILPVGATHMNRGKVHVKFDQVYDIAPEDDTESDKTANRHQARIFLPVDKLYDYASFGDPLTTNDALGGYTRNSTAYTLDNDPNRCTYAQQLPVQGDYDPRPKPSQRLYLIVRALNTTMQREGNWTAGTTQAGGPLPNILDPPSPENTPSYDIVIRKKEMFDD